MAEEKLMLAYVNGPEAYFHTDGSLYAPHSVVEVPAKWVSTEKSIPEELEVTNRAGEKTKITVQRKVKFRPIDGPPPIGRPAAQQADKLNVSSFLAQGLDDILPAIEVGSVDDALGVVEQAELSGKNRKGVRDAIVDRIATLKRG
jgi:hypothetical protein